MATYNHEDTAWALGRPVPSQNGTVDITNPLTSYYYGDPVHPMIPRVVGIGHEETLRAYERLLNPLPPAATSCQHCWCGDPGTINNKPHVSCCMCQTRRVK